MTGPRWGAQLRRGELYGIRRPSDDVKRSRVVVVVSRDARLASRFSTAICAPVYSQRGGLSTEVEVGPAEGLKHPSAILCDVLTSFPRSRLTDYVGTLWPTKLAARHAADRWRRRMSLAGNIKRTRVVLENLMRRVEERIAEQQSPRPPRGSVSSFFELGSESITLVKPDGTRITTQADIDSTSNRIFAYEPTLPVEAGDSIERALPNGKTQIYEVSHADWLGAPGDNLAIGNSMSKFVVSQCHKHNHSRRK